MASISVSPALQPASPFESRSPPSSPSRAHRRQVSRNPNAEPLPSFSFNVNSLGDTRTTPTEPESPNENTMDFNILKSVQPPPLPEFKFNPGADLPPARSPSPTHPVLQEMALNQQRVSRSARPAPLPAFTFSPHTSSGQASPSPTKSTFSDMPHSAGSSIIGHRRRGSEFVGGANGGPQLISSSPEKPEYRPPPVSGPPRGHTHRRSQAVSISDIEASDLIKAAALSKARAGSTPTTPSEIAQQFSFPRQSPQPRQSPPQTSRSPPSSPLRRDSAPGIRPRVGFADRVEMIPRPLSLISSETEGSCSTIRGGHSVSGSINSIAASPPPRTLHNVTSPGGLEVVESPPERPRTADPATLLFSGAARADKSMSIVNLPKRPLSASGSPAVTASGSPPTKKKHFWFSNSPTLSPTPTPKVEKNDPLEAPSSMVLEPVPNAPKSKTSPERTGSVKKRKYHTWTSGIFPRKAGKRGAKTKSKRTPTPPALIRRASDRINDIFDADDTIVLREPSPVAQRSRPRPKTAIPHVPSVSVHDSDVASPILDLDAELNPFDQERSGPDTPTRTPAARIAKLHSSERRGNTDAFGSFHKRSESAPSMQPVNRGSFNMQRIGSNSSLNEVFDEEEEDNFLADQTAVSSDAESSRKVSNPTERSTSQFDDGSESNISPGTKPIDGLGLSVQGESSDGVVIVDLEDDIAQAEHRSSKSTIEAPTFREFAKRPTSSPMIFSYPAPQSQYASSTEGRTTSASMISSPDPEHISFDNFPRTNNRFPGEPSPDFALRASNEDLPSLSDSISSGAVPRISSSANTRSSVEQRSASVCVPATPRSSNPAWKRASLASLNRLIPGSANGSKLKFETVPDLPPTDEKARKKTNRISKLMHFWRSKEKETN